MKSVAHDVAIFLVAAGALTIGGTAQWCLNVGTEPNDPADTITVYDTGGGEPDTDELNISRPTVQLRTRSVDYTEGYDKHATLRGLLVSAAPFENDDDDARFLSVRMTSEIIAIGRDEKNRHLLTSNYEILREEI